MTHIYEKRAMSPQELAEVLRKDPAQISRELKRLDRFGFIDRPKRAKWPKENWRITKKGKTIKRMRRPVKLTVEGGLYVFLCDMISQLEEGRSLDDLKLTYLWDLLSRRIEENPEWMLRSLRNVQKHTGRLAADLEQWIRLQQHS